MEGVYTFAVATAISILMVILVGLRPSKWTVLLATLLYVVAIAVWFIPLFPATNATDKDVTNTMLGIILGGALVLCIASFWVVELYDLDFDEAVIVTLFAGFVVGVAVWGGVKIVYGVTQYPLYNQSQTHEELTYATEWQTEPTGVETIIYENNKGVTVQMDTPYGWTDISTIEDESALVYGHKFRVTKDGAFVDIPSTDVDFVEVSGLLTGDYKSIAKVRVTKVKLVEQTTKKVLRVDSNYVLEQRITDKVVVEYKVTNRDEIQQRIDEDAKREQTKAQTKEALQQFITNTKGE